MKEDTPHYRITDWAEEERPRERLERLGPEHLSTAELLAILLRVGAPGEHAVALARRLLQTFGGLSGLRRAPFTELKAVRGMGRAKAAQVKAALELARRLKWEPDQRPQIRSPEDVVALLMDEMAALEQEVLRVLLLDTRHRLLHIHEVARGSVNQMTVRVAELFREAVRHNTVALLLVHNHPSGDPSPSPEDVAFTRQVVEAGRVLEVRVLDHIILGRGRFVSMRARGLAPFPD